MPSAVLSLATLGSTASLTIPTTSGQPGRIVCELISGAGPIAVTNDGSLPVAASSTITTSNQSWVPNIVGGSVVFPPTYSGGQPPASITINALGGSTANTAQLLVAW